MRHFLILTTLLSSLLFAQNKALYVLAHPSDEVYVSGSIQYLLSLGWDVRLVYTCDGSSGKNLNNICGSVPITECRCLELLDALNELGISESDVTLLNKPDGTIWHKGWKDKEGNFHKGNLTLIIEELTNIMDIEKPSTVVTFSPNGQNLQEDHIYTGLATAYAFDKQSTPEKLYYTVTNKEASEIFNTQVSQFIDSITTKSVDLTIPTQSFNETKKNSLSWHKSEYSFGDVIKWEKYFTNYPKETYLIGRDRTRQ